ncbi:MAG: hypothetical protein HY881_09045 [Deltaproteobacteria bacterium]|nr:hypothetical protein [Deltaproteobacteria bacterium]
MNFFDSMQTSASGLTVQRLRMNLVAINPAKTDTTRTEQGGPYQRKEPVSTAAPIQSAFDEVLKAKLGNKSTKENGADVINDQQKTLLKYDSLHPDAVPQGLVSMPNRPGNVRELKNIMERLAVLTQEGEIYPRDLPQKLRTAPSDTAATSDVKVPDQGICVSTAVSDFEKSLISQSMKITNSVKKNSAKLINIKRHNLEDIFA